MANNPVMDRNPYFRGQTMPNGYPSQTQYGQQYDAYGQPVYGQQPGVNQFAGQQAYAPQAAGGGVFTPGSSASATMTYDDAMVKTTVLLAFTIITAMLGAFYAAGLFLGAPPMAFGLMIAAVSSLMMTLTHYATGTAPVIFGSGYTTLGEWWKAGLVMSVVNLLVFVVVGGIWWKALGYW